MDCGKIILEKLSQRICEYFSIHLDLHIQSHYQIKSVERIHFSNATALISLTDSANKATIAMSVSNLFVQLMLVRFLNGNLPNADLIELSHENLAETLNITLGNIIEDLPPKCGEINISTPYLMNNQIIIHKREFAQMYISELKIGEERILISYFN